MTRPMARTSRALKHSRLSIATAIVLYGASAFASPSLLSTQAGTDHVLLPAGVYAGNEPGLKLVQQYGSLQLWQVDAAHRHELNSVARNSMQLQSKSVNFEAGAFDPALPLNVPAAFGVAKGDGARIHIVQFNGPVTDDLLASIQAAGARIVASLSGNAYAVLADAPAASRVVQATQANPLTRAVTALPGYYKLAGRLADRVQTGLSPGAELDVTVQIAKHAGSAASKARIEALHRGTSAAPLVWDDRLTLESLRLRIVETDLATIADIADVFAIEPFVARRKYDEVQAQIVAGNLDGAQAGPSGIGYRAWLAGRGFPTTPASYPIVDVVDDGLGTGTAADGGGDVTFRELGLVGNPSRVSTVFNCTSNPTADGLAGHGHLNANVVGGYDPRGDAAGIQGPFEDPEGFLRGQGINPYTRLAATKIFTNAGGFSIVNCGGVDSGLIKSSQDRGAPITSNSWGAPVGGDYDDSSQAWDIGTRDADLVEAGLQPMIHIFAAGNQGAGASTVGSPGSGKNVITVGASENDRPGPDETGAWNDGCGIGAAGANSAMDVIGFSSRGPVDGGRAKPEVIAPGTHVQGTASTAPGFDGTGVCDQFRPTNQTVYASSSGTSHSTPAIAGVASLVYYWMQTEHAITAPSAAGIKAYLMAHPTYLTGVSANDNLPSNNQGYGMPNLGRAFDDTTLTVVRDQSTTFAGTGETFVLAGGVADPAKPVRIAIAWTDAPGNINDLSPQRNNLNLTAIVNGISYTGNRFTGAFSTAGGGAADTANNYEAIFLPAGTTGSVQITVTAATIGSDGVIGNADLTDQDFAFVASNVAQTPDFFVSATPSVQQSCGVDDVTFNVTVGEFNGYDGTVDLSLVGLPAGATSSFGVATGVTPYATTLDIDTLAALADGNYPLTIEGEDGTTTHTAAISLQHSQSATVATTLTAPATGAIDVALRPTFTWSAVPGALEYVLEVDNDPAFGSIDYTATVAGTSHQPPSNLSGATTYNWRVRGVNNCGGGANSPVFTFTTVAVYCAAPAAPIPDNAPAGGLISNIVVASGSALTDLDVDFDATHTWAGDLIVSLRHVETGTSVVIYDRPGFTGTGFGCSGDNPDLIIDDEGTGSVEATCLNATPAYPVGARRTPNNPLTAFDTQNFAGTWELTVTDNAASDTGSLDEWCLVPTMAPAVVDAVADTFAATEDTLLTVPTPGVLANDTGPGTLTATIATPPANGTLVGGLNTNGGFAYEPADDFCGADTFTYTASNGTLNDTATVTINVACVNDAPVANADAFAATEDTPLVLAAPGVLSNDTDIDVPAQTLTATNVTQPTNGTVVLAANGSFTYTPDDDYCDAAVADTFTYTAFDGTATSAPATVSVTVACVNDGPIAGTIDDATAVATVAFSLDVSDAFTEPKGEALTFSATGLPASLTIAPATGIISGTATLAEIGTYTVTVTADDPSGADASAQFTLDVVGIAIFANGFESP